MKKICILLLFVILLAGCNTTNNEIFNTSYDVDINIDDISKAFVPAAKKGSESLIGISVYAKKTILGEYQEYSRGSGVVYKGIAYLKDGTITEDIETTKDSNEVNKYKYFAVTNEHVIKSNLINSVIKIYFGEQNILVDGVVLGKDTMEDLAVVSFETSIYITPIEFEDSDKIQKGEFVMAIGNSEGYEYFSTTTLGIISHPKRYIEVNRDKNSDGIDETKVSCEYIQHDASINSGNSGGLLINSQGKLLGINTIKLMDKEEYIEGMGFAIPSNIVLKFIPYLEKGNTYKGYSISSTLYSVNDLKNTDISNAPEIKLQALNEFDYGVYVLNISVNKLGIESNDLILEVNDEKVYDSKIFNTKIRYLNDTTVKLKIIRNNKLIEYLVDL